MSDDKYSLLNLDALSKPACKLIEAVQRAIGAIFEPHRIVRKAKADAEARLILAHADAEAKEISYRANVRISHLELRREKNIEAITLNAIKELPESVDDRPLDEDWIVHFFNSCQDIGDKEMQILWSKLLAGEVTHPGKYALRTMNLVKTLNKDEAQLFTKYCSYLLQDTNGFYLRPNIEETKELFWKEGLHALAINHLKDIGLIATNDLVFPFNRHIDYEFYYFKQKYVLRFTGSFLTFNLPVNTLTDTGNELVAISGANYNEQYEVCLTEALKKHSIDLSIIQG